MIIILAVALVLLFLVVFDKILLRKKRVREIRQLQHDWGRCASKKIRDFDLLDRELGQHLVGENSYALDSTTAFDLDLKLVFAKIDRSISKTGEIYSYARLNRPLLVENDINRFAELKLKFKSDPTLRDRVIESLYFLKDRGAYFVYQLTRYKRTNAKVPLWCFFLLALASTSTFVLSFFFPQLVILLAPLILVNFVLHYQNKHKIFELYTSIMQLEKLGQCLKSMPDPLLFEFPELKNGYQSLKPLLRRSNLISSIERSSDLDMFYQFFIELLNYITLREVILTQWLVKGLEGKGETIKIVLDTIGYIDCAQAVAAYCEENEEVSLPVFHHKREVKFEDLMHPLIENCIPNSLTICNNILITGSNMSGKTSFMRTVGVNAILAQAFGIVFAKSFAVPLLRVYSVMRLSDDLEERVSYFMEEALAVNGVIQKVNQNSGFSLCLFDELYKGTNTIDRISGATATLNFLNGGQTIVMASTHDMELTELLPEYKNYYFDEHIESQELKFDYTIKEGINTKRNAIKMMRLAGLPSTITDAAKALSAQLLQSP